MSTPGRWHVLTGEYPPQPGGVSDYTAMVAAGLAAAGAEVHVWAPPADGDTPPAPGVAVHRDAGRWSPADLAALDARLDAFAAPRRLLVQYTPNAWGYRGANLGFCRWLARRHRAGDRVLTMVHEAVYDWRPGDKPTRLALAAAHRLMIRTVLRGSDRLYCSALALERRLPGLGAAGRPLRWLPVPSTVPTVDDPEGVAAVRRRLAPRGEAIVGTFGTFGEDLQRDLARALPALLRGRDDRVGLLIGRNGARVAAALTGADPALAGRVTATGGLPPGDASRHLQACDVLVMPYVDGVSSRRTTAMAALAHGLPTATNLGPNSEPLWAESGAVAAAAAPDPEAVARLAGGLLADPAARAALSAAARDLYARRFAVALTVDALLADESRGGAC